jgi:hypothetical protein
MSILEEIVNPGTFEVPRDCDRAELIERMNALAASGHALNFEEMFPPGRPEKFGSVRVTHYKSCMACRKGKVL